MAVAHDSPLDSQPKKGVSSYMRKGVAPRDHFLFLAQDFDQGPAITVLRTVGSFQGSRCARTHVHVFVLMGTCVRICM